MGERAGVSREKDILDPAGASEPSSPHYHAPLLKRAIFVGKLPLSSPFALSVSSLSSTSERFRAFRTKRRGLVLNLPKPKLVLNALFPS